MIADSRHVIHHGLPLIRYRQPFDELSCPGAGPLPDILEAFGGQLRRFQTTRQQIADHIVGEELHAAIRVVNHEELPRAQQFVADDQGSDGIIARTPSCIPNDMGIALRQSGILRWVQPGVHAGEDRKAARRRKGQFATLTKALTVLLICLQYLIQYFAHDASVWRPAFRLCPPTSRRVNAKRPTVDTRGPLRSLSLKHLQTGPRPRFSKQQQVSRLCERCMLAW